MKQAFALLRGGVLSVLAILLGLLLLVWPGSSSDVASAGGVLILAQQGETRDEKIRRVENGLLPPAVIKGEPASLMKLEDRMRFHKTPGLSIAVINDGRK